MSSDQPVLPYPEAGGTEFTSGWSGSDTSHERAQREDRQGITAKRQRETLAFVAACGRDGVTVADLRDITGWHHGQASSALSVLHKTGQLVRLTERRDRCQVYVHPDFSEGRDEAPYRPNGRNRSDEKVAQARQLLERYEEMRKSFTQGSHLWRELDRQVAEFLRGDAK